MLAFILINSFKYINCVGASHMGLLDKILIAYGLQKSTGKPVKAPGRRKPKPTKTFLRMIHKGFRVYDGYYVVVTASPMAS